MSRELGGAHVVVVGGGLAGIAAALDCAEAGAAVTLLEARRRLGGAAYSYARDGLCVDNGQHIFLRCCTEYRDLVRRLGADALVTLQDRLHLDVLAPGGRRAQLWRSGLPAPLHLAPALVRFGLLSLRERVALARAMRALDGVDIEDPATDRTPFGEWLDAHHQGAGVTEAVWNLIGRPTVNLDVREASLAQVAQVFQVGLLRDPAAADIGYATAPLSRIHDLAAQRALAAAGVQVRVRCAASSLERADGRLRVETSAGPPLAADAVVLAVPPDRAARLLPAAAGVEPGTLAGLGSSPIVNLHVVLDRRVLAGPFAAGVFSPVQWMFDRTASSGLGSGQYLAISLSAAGEELSMTADALRARYLPALADLLPAAREAEVVGFFVSREHAATFRATPGARAARPPARTRLPGLVLAGSWTDTGWPATMEGAVRSGRAAAGELRRSAAQREWSPAHRAETVAVSP